MDSDTLYHWTCGSGRLNLSLALSDAKACSHPGDCEADVLALMACDDISAQIEAMNPDIVRAELREYGAWDDEELADHRANLKRLVWIAACDVAEQPEDYV